MRKIILERAEVKYLDRFIVSLMSEISFDVQVVSLKRSKKK